MQVLRQLPPVTDPNVLVGTNPADDAVIYRLNGRLALVETVDFFPPVVDDPFDFGAIAAANAVSDIYAKGGRPIMALNIVCFPRTLPQEVLVQILKGGAAKAAEAGFSIVGGHTIDDPVPKYGMAVTGLIRPGKEIAKASARAGDSIVLTKPLGTGIITTAIKAGLAGEAAERKAVATMSQLNKAASEAMLEAGVNAATDVTGFGLLGHLYEMCSNSGVGARIWPAAVPVIEETWGLAAKGLVPGGSHRNLQFVGGHVTWGPEVSDDARLVLCDAQTSGGLLLSVSREKSARLVDGLKKRGVLAAVIGDMVEAGAGRLWVE